MTAVFLAAILVLIAGGLAAAVTSRRPGVASALGAVSCFAGAGLGLAAVAPVLSGASLAVEAAWTVPQANFTLAVDAVSAAFLVPILVLALAGAPYAFGYWKAYRGRRLAAAWFFFNLLVAAMLLVAAARNAVLFLVAWELMALAAFFLITLDHEDSGVRSAGWTYLVAAHFGVLLLFALFLVLGSQAHSLDFAAFAGLAPSRPLAAVLFLLALAGFGLKAALPGLHVWLPDAHAAAPSHVSAMLSGAMLNLGLYGIVRVMSWAAPAEAWWGITLLVFGVAGAVLGIGLGAVQRDIKRVLAYSSIENMGLIVAALGTAVWASSRGLAGVASLAIMAALLHMWNHALMKGLLFLGAGGIVHATGTRNLEHLGGLLKKMPINAALMVFGAIAICGLPPLNGFVSEWLLYMSLAQGGMAGEGAANLTLLAGVGLVALTGGIAVLTFVRMCGVALLGLPRTPAAAHAHEPARVMLLPMAALVLLCGIFAVAPGLAVSALQGAAREAIPGMGFVPFSLADRLGMWNAAVLAALGAGGLIFGRRILRAAPADVGTWACGYARPSARMQYTARSFTGSFSDQILPHALQPVSARSQGDGPFPATGALATEYPEPARDGFFVPLFTKIENAMLRLRWLQQGLLHAYVLHILLFLLGLLVWMSFFASGGT